MLQFLPISWSHRTFPTQFFRQVLTPSYFSRFRYTRLDHKSAHMIKGQISISMSRLFYALCCKFFGSSTQPLLIWYKFSLQLTSLISCGKDLIIASQRKHTIQAKCLRSTLTGVCMKINIAKMATRRSQFSDSSQPHFRGHVFLCRMSGAPI